MPPPLTGYSRLDKEVIKAIAPENRSDRYTLAVSSVEPGIIEPEWYMFIAESTAEPDDDQVLMPNDNPEAGRWHKYAGNRGGASLGGVILCTNECVSTGYGSGKVFQFFAPQQNQEIVIQPRFDIGIAESISLATRLPDAIAVYRWNEEPNVDRFGWDETPVITLPAKGGKFRITVDATWRWITVFARNWDSGGYLDCCCIVIHGNTITLLGFN